MCHWYLSLTKDVLRLLVQAYIHCRLDYCNAVLAGIADTVIKRLQSIQNTSASLVSVARLPDDVKALLRSLHWLSVRCGRESFPRPQPQPQPHPYLYLYELCVTVENVWMLSSLAGIMYLWRIHVPGVQTPTGQRSSACYAPTVCRTGLTIQGPHTNARRRPLPSH